ncbi:MAG: DUF58 domain-containing protein [Lachnospiraceae bacterium]|nr:DUF58 domain-containing protein [Lachnospiraceae bacterium]
MQPKQNNGSNFVTRPGLIILALLILVSNYFSIQSLTLFFGICLAISLLSYFWGKKILEGVKLSCKTSTNTVFPDTTFSLGFSIHNLHLLPIIWLDLILFTGNRGVVCAEEDSFNGTFRTKEDATGRNGIQQRFTWIMGKQTLSGTLTLSAVKRGIWRPDYILLESGDGLGLSVEVKKYQLPFPLSVTVYPRIYPVSCDSFLQISQDSKTCANGFYEDVTTLSNVRPYQTGDSTRYLNWRLLAAQNSMQINQYETLAPADVCFYLDLQSFTFTPEQDPAPGEEVSLAVSEEYLETAISLIASCVIELTRKHILCVLFLPGFGIHESQTITPEGISSQVEHLLTVLSGISYTAGPVSARKTHFLDQSRDAIRHRNGSLYLLCKDAERLSPDCKRLLDEDPGTTLLVPEIKDFDRYQSHPIKTWKEIYQVEQTVFLHLN